MADHKKILIHIGTGKTGSSSIQKTLSIAHEEKRIAPIVYPRILPEYDGHEFLLYAFEDPAKLPRGHYQKYHNSDKGSRYNMELLKSKLEEATFGYENLILSSEYLGRFSPGGIASLKKFLFKAGFNTIKILVYVREPSSYYLSFIQQQLKASCEFTHPDQFRYPFKSMILKWAKAFSMADIIVRPYDVAKFRNQCVVHDFIDIVEGFFGSKINKDIVIYKKNESLSSEAMIIAQKYRQLFHSSNNNVFKSDSNMLLSMMIEFQNKHNKFTRPELRKAIQRIILRNHINDLVWLKDSFGIDFGISIDSNHYDDNESHSIVNGSIENALEAYDYDILLDTLFACLYGLLNPSQNNKTPERESWSIT